LIVCRTRIDALEGNQLLGEEFWADFQVAAIHFAKAVNELPRPNFNRTPEPGPNFGVNNWPFGEPRRGGLAWISLRGYEYGEA